MTTVGGIAEEVDVEWRSTEPRRRADDAGRWIDGSHGRVTAGTLCRLRRSRKITAEVKIKQRV